MPTILVTLDPANVPAEAKRRIEQLAPDRELLITRDHAEMHARLDDLEIVAGYPPRQLLLDAPALRWYQQWSAGADWLLRHPEALERAFVITNARGIHAGQITEHVFAQLLALARHLPAAHAAQQRREWWKPAANDLFDLEGKAMLVIGTGAIGARIMRVAQAFGMDVIGVRRTPGEDAGPPRIVSVDRLDRELPAADVVVMTTPLTARTRNMLDERRLRLMKPGAYLINIGRGGTIDETALAAALTDGHLAGAGLDVFAQEPLPADSPLWDSPNLLITGHYSGDTPDYDRRALALFLDNLERYVAGREMRNVVDKVEGY